MQNAMFVRVVNGVRQLSDEFRRLPGRNRRVVRQPRQAGRLRQTSC